VIGTECFLIAVAYRIIASNEWVQLSPSGSPPTPRCITSSVVTPDESAILIFGGNIRYGGNPYVNELYRYSIAHNSWELLKPSGKPPRARVGHTAVVIGDHMVRIPV
jgi:hypothetical protein